MWKVTKMNKKFCKSTSMVLAEVCKALKTNPRVYFSGKKILLILMGNWCIVFWEISLRVIPDYHHKQEKSQRKEFINFLKKPNKWHLQGRFLWAWKYIFKLPFFFCHCWKLLLREWKVNASVESNIWKRNFWKRNQMQNILKAHKSRRRENS